MIFAVTKLLCMEFPSWYLEQPSTLPRDDKISDTLSLFHNIFT